MQHQIHTLEKEPIRGSDLISAIKPQYSEKHKKFYLSSLRATIVCFRRFIRAFSKAKRRLSKRDASNKGKSAVVSGSSVTTTHHVLVVPSILIAPGVHTRISGTPTSHNKGNKLKPLEAHPPPGNQILRLQCLLWIYLSPSSSLPAHVTVATDGNSVNVKKLQEWHLQKQSHVTTRIGRKVKWFCMVLHIRFS